MIANKKEGEKWWIDYKGDKIGEEKRESIKPTLKTKTIKLPSI